MTESPRYIGGIHYIQVDSLDLFLAKTCGRSLEEAQANARLIAASPELAYQLEESIHMIERLRGWIKAIADGSKTADKAASVVESSHALNESSRALLAKTEGAK